MPWNFCVRMLHIYIALLPDIISSTSDVRELVSVEDVMEDSDLRFGPNGGLVFCMEYLIENLDWLKDQLDEVEEDYILFDCPGKQKLLYQYSQFSTYNSYTEFSLNIK